MRVFPLASFVWLVFSTPALADETSDSGAQEPESGISSEKPQSSSASTPPKVSNVNLATPEQLAALGGLKVGLDFDTGVGSGTFANPGLYAYAASALYLSPNYSFHWLGRDFLATGRASVLIEYTRPDAPTGRRVSWADVRFGLQAPGIWREPRSGISLTPSMGVLIPATLESFRAGTITAFSARALFRQAFFGGRLDVRYALAGAANILTQSHVALPARTGAGGLPLQLCRANEVGAACGSAGMNNVFAVTNTLFANFVLSTKWVVSASYSLTNQWAAAATWVDDEFVPPAVDSEGDPVAQVGMGRRDLTTGSVGVTYQLTEQLSASVGLSTTGAPLTSDNKAVRIPFIDVWSPESNLTWYSATLSAYF